MGMVMRVRMVVLATGVVVMGILAATGVLAVAAVAGMAVRAVVLEAVPAVTGTAEDIDNGKRG